MTTPLRLAEFIGAVSLATDLGMGQPLEQGMRTCLVAMELAEAADVDRGVRSEIFYTALLRFLGCTADAHDTAAISGDDIALRAAIAPVLGAPPSDFLPAVLPVLGRGLPGPQRAAIVARFLVSGPSHMRDGVWAHCEAAEVLAMRLGLPDGTRAALAAAFEFWNGRGFPNGVRGEAIPLAARVVMIARDIEVIGRLSDADAVRSALRERAGRSYDPALAAVASAGLDELVEAARAEMPGLSQQFLAYGQQRLERGAMRLAQGRRSSGVVEAVVVVDENAGIGHGHSMRAARGGWGCLACGDRDTHAG